MNGMTAVWKKFIVLGLEEDGVAFDWTARTVSECSAAPHTNKNESSATLIAKSSGVWAAEEGLRAVELVSEEMGSPLRAKSLLKDGAEFAPKQALATFTGNAETILAFERTFINLAAYTSGIATQTHELVSMVLSASKKSAVRTIPRITATRKTLPGFRDLAVQSTLVGGASPHRYNLSGGLLLKENHIAACGGISRAVAAAKKVAPHLLKVEIEVRSLEEFKHAIEAGAEVIMLDNFSPTLLAEALKIKPTNITLEVSGGINASNISQYVLQGVDVISIGSLTHSVKACDFSLLMDTVK